MLKDINILRIHLIIFATSNAANLKDVLTRTQRYRKSKPSVEVWMLPLAFAAKRPRASSRFWTMASRLWIAVAKVQIESPANTGKQIQFEQLNDEQWSNWQRHYITTLHVDILKYNIYIHTYILRYALTVSSY